MRLPRDISAGAARRRALLFDGLAAAGIAILAISLSAGLGIVGALALVTLVLLLAWTVGESLLRRRRRRSERRRSDPRRSDPLPEQ